MKTRRKEKNNWPQINTDNPRTGRRRGHSTDKKQKQEKEMIYLRKAGNSGKKTKRQEEGKKQEVRSKKQGDK